MSAFDDAMAEADKVIYGTFGDPGNYSNGSDDCDCQVIVSIDLVVVGDNFANVMQDQIEVLLPIDLPITQGGIFTVNSTSYEAMRELSNDGSEAIWQINEV